MVTETLDPILTEAEYRAWLGISAPTAQRQRSDGSGPPFIQLSERRIGYRKSAVEQWLEERTTSRTGSLTSQKVVSATRTRENECKAIPRKAATVTAAVTRDITAAIMPPKSKTEV